MHQLLKQAAGGLTPEGGEGLPPRCALADMFSKALEPMPNIHSTVKVVVNATLT
ncbi:hypothetical protein [Myxococcus sp. SDU36]|uniref:hypothetical protein n=1 Tax=Myxococcus sp. SDU36 TaxID=2831967 RepID=UPI0025438DAA|nr:hypothetical protein [Myxococcus sp. SDU36]WIG98107.1 hypothetical protein KGD87_12380 [Myxococcus sp. SDU36]